MIARARSLLRAYFTAQVLLAYGAACFLGGLATGTALAVAMIGAAT